MMGSSEKTAKKLVSSEDTKWMRSNGLTIENFAGLPKISNSKRTNAHENMRTISTHGWSENFISCRLA
ncbi:unnamed protein product [Thelazia callipaeda]|uniref:Ovule protein n=1 Tax=Thelazia callipaeda TaxID=103827 RepID=A0A0N5DB32_THECL|nr:unnamed protein product [Thelazia callipaeda]